MRHQRQALKVYMNDEECGRLLDRAGACDLSISAYLRTLGLGYQPKSTLDAQAVLSLLKINADQGRLGGLLKLWLTERPNVGASGFDVRRLLREIESTQAKLRGIVSHL